jgi:hypothetical protein
MSGYDLLNTSVTILSFGDQIQPGTYALHSRYDSCLNLQNQEKLLSCTYKLGWAGPIQIIMHGVDLNQIESVVIRDRQMMINQDYDLPIADDVIFESSIELQDIAVERMENNIGLSIAALLECAHVKSLAFIFDRSRSRHFSSAFETVFFNHVVAGVDTMLQGDVLGGLCSLKGVGFGLTPSGDDFIAGFLFGLYLLQQIHRSDLSGLRATIYARARGSSLLANTFLALASQGRFSERLKDFVGVLCNNDPSQVIPAMKQVMAMGSTSGADLLCGFFFALITLKDKLLCEVGYDLLWFPSSSLGTR